MEPIGESRGINMESTLAQTTLGREISKAILTELDSSVAQPEPIFPPLPASPTPCSFSECSAGHRWPPRLAIVTCAGCGGPCLATEMVNCPSCNEPATRMMLRTEHLTRAMGLSKSCCGETSQGESGVMVSQRTFWQKTEEMGGPRHALETARPAEAPPAEVTQ